MVVSFIGGGNRRTQRKPLPQVTDKLYHIMLYTRAIEKGNHSFFNFNDTTSPTEASNGLCHILGEYHDPTMSRIHVVTHDNQMILRSPFQLHLCFQNGHQKPQFEEG
jgi:hypothetical protein